MRSPFDRCRGHRPQKLEADPNPFAIVVMAHLKTPKTSQDVASRGQWKWALTKRLYGRGYSRQEILNLFHIIDWLMQLPEALKELYWAEIEAYETERTMTYISSIERLGYERGEKAGEQKGEQKGLLVAIKLGLKLKFGAEGLQLYAIVAEIEDVARLQSICDGLNGDATLDEIRRSCEG